MSLIERTTAMIRMLASIVVLLALVTPILLLIKFRKLFALANGKNTNFEGVSENISNHSSSIGAKKCPKKCFSIFGRANFEGVSPFY